MSITTVSLINHKLSIDTECPSSMSEEMIGSDNHERAPTSVQVHSAVKVSFGWEPIKVDYLVTPRITKQVSRPPRHYRHPAMAMPYLHTCSTAYTKALEQAEQLISREKSPVTRD